MYVVYCFNFTLFPNATQLYILFFYYLYLNSTDYVRPNIRMSEQFWVCSDTLSEHFKKVISGTAVLLTKELNQPFKLRSMFSNT